MELSVVGISSARRFLVPGGPDTSRGLAGTRGILYRSYCTAVSSSNDGSPTEMTRSKASSSSGERGGQQIIAIGRRMKQRLTSSPIGDGGVSPLTQAPATGSGFGTSSMGLAQYSLPGDRPSTKSPTMSPFASNATGVAEKRKVGVRPKSGRSAAQRERLMLYKECLRSANSLLHADSRSNLKAYIRKEFKSKAASIRKSDFAAIEWQVQHGQRQLMTLRAMRPDSRFTLK